MGKELDMDCAPALPTFRFHVGVTGHRFTNPVYAQNRDAIAAVVDQIFETLEIVASQTSGSSTQAIPIRVHSLLVDGFDQNAAQQALSRGWSLVAPLPFGVTLNTAINARPHDLGEAQFLLTQKGICGAQTQERAQQINALISAATCFELAEQDDYIAHLFLETKRAPANSASAQAFAFAASQRVEMAARVMIEQSDVVIGVWDGANTSFTGGTGHTIALALTLGVPVLWIDAAMPTRWHLLRSPEDLADRQSQARQNPPLDSIFEDLILSAKGNTTSHQKGKKADHLEGINALLGDTWRPHSQKRWHAYRRVEAIFGDQTFGNRFKSLRQTYESPQQILTGSAAPTLEAALALPTQERAFVDAIGTKVLGRFAWADGISARLSDSYRSGMVMNFMFSAFAIAGGIAYLPFASSAQKWRFALFELALLVAIVAIIWVGQKRRWHGRWFETRRVAEYLRHAPILLALGIARPAYLWPSGTHTSWPESYVRHTLRDIGLPGVTITTDYIHNALARLLKPFVAGQIRYHDSKAKRLARVHHNLDRLSERLFQLAIASVSVYLVLYGAGALKIINPDVPYQLSKLFTFLGVLLPTFGGAIAGIRYFGDFERFSAISAVTARKLETIDARIAILLKAPRTSLTYAQAAELGHATDDIVIGEIESWQAVFSGKHMTVPV